MTFVILKILKLHATWFELGLALALENTSAEFGEATSNFLEKFRGNNFS